MRCFIERQTHPRSWRRIGHFIERTYCGAGLRLSTALKLFEIDISSGPTRYQQGAATQFSIRTPPGATGPLE